MWLDPSTVIVLTCMCLCIYVKNQLGNKKKFKLYGRYEHAQEGFVFYAIPYQYIWRGFTRNGSKCYWIKKQNSLACTPTRHSILTLYHFKRRSFLFRFKSYCVKVMKNDLHSKTWALFTWMYTKLHVHIEPKEVYM